MAQVIYIGGEATAAGFRLAGVDTRVASAGDAAEALRQAFSERPDCVLFDGTLVDYVPAAELEHALVALSPLFAVIPDVRGRGTPPNLARMVRNALGIDLMNDVESLLEAQTTALLRRLGREQESRTRHIRDEAATQAADIVRRARVEARTRVHQAVVDTRREDEMALARRRAALDTQARRSRQATLRELLDRAWQALPAALQSRWLDATARERWCDAACVSAIRSLRHLDRLQVEVDPQWLAHVGPLVRSRLDGPSKVDVTASAGLGAGLRIRAGDACIDATVAGLLAARERIASELLAEFERQAAARRAERTR